MSAGWAVSRLGGSAAELHARGWPGPARRGVALCLPEGPALVLGSTQDQRLVDRSGAAAAGVALVRRRTGGGMVLLQPGDLVWVDVDVPAGDRLWDDDVARAFSWVGQAWAGAAADLGVPGPRPHPGPMEEGRWGRLVCFAGLGPGEVTVDGRKLVGLAQRRTRAGARFQCALLLRWEPSALLGLLAFEDAERAGAAEDLASAAVGLSELGVDAGPEDVLDALRARLPTD
jgi:lipoate---protein ligase